MRPIPGCNQVSIHPFSLPVTLVWGIRIPWSWLRFRKRARESESRVGGVLELLVEASRKERRKESRGWEGRPCSECEWTTGPSRAGSSAGQDAHGKALI